MSTSNELLESIDIPASLRKKTTIASARYYDKVDIFSNCVSGYQNGQLAQTWFFKDYSGIEVVKANLNSQFAQVIFLTGINSRNKVVGVDVMSIQNRMAMQDTNRIILCGGMFSYAAANEFADNLGAKIRKVFEEYKINENETETSFSTISAADEIKKFKELLDSGIITQEEFEAKKKQLLGL